MTFRDGSKSRFVSAAGDDTRKGEGIGDGRTTKAKPYGEGGQRRFNRASGAIRHRRSFRGRAKGAIDNYRTFVYHCHV